MKLWAGRFQKDTDKAMNDFHSSIHFDYRLYKEDITGSIAHAKMLGKQGIIPTEDSTLIIKTLKEILSEIEDGTLEFMVDAEDIHMNIESFLISKIGDVGKRLHTGRSRNDQVALDIRMYMKNQILIIKELLKDCCNVLIEKADENKANIMPGYTHLQKAQPITMGFHLLSWVNMLLRDIDRCNDCFKRCDVMPLGSGALAGTTYPLDREFVAKELGFAKISDNSLDAVSDRDFLIEFANTASLTMMHLSRMCEELILWSSLEFGYIEMDDAYSTGSSIMPQKKNPDAAELIRGKAGRVFGDLIALLSMMKNLPLAYNKDMQEDKESVFDIIDTLNGCLPIFAKMVKTFKVKKENMLNSASQGFTNATDAADYLVKKGMPFRTAHEVVGKLVFYCIEKKVGILDCTIDELKSFSDLFENDLYKEIDLLTCVNQRDIVGAPAIKQVEKAIIKAKSDLEKLF